MKLPVKKEFEWNKINSFKDVNPYCIAFVYPKDENPYIVKGGLQNVEKWIKSHQETPAIVHLTLWYKKSHRRIIQTVNTNKKIYFFRGVTDKKIHITYYDKLKRKRTILKKIRNIPRKWIKELNQFC